MAPWQTTAAVDPEYLHSFSRDQRCDRYHAAISASLLQDIVQLIGNVPGLLR